MPFPPLTPRTVRWRPLDGSGIEHLSVAPISTGVLVRSVLIGDRDAAPYGVAYRIECDQRWRVRALDLEATDGRQLGLRSNGRGRWIDADGAKQPALDGCIDIDLAGTPFTNTLPIRRLDLVAGEAAELQMVYVPFDSFTPFVDSQLYRCIDPGRLYRYEAIDRSFSADLPVDADGLVTDYPTLFERV